MLRSSAVAYHVGSPGLSPGCNRKDIHHKTCVKSIMRITPLWWPWIGISRNDKKSIIVMKHQIWKQKTHPSHRLLQVYVYCVFNLFISFFFPFCRQTVAGRMLLLPHQWRHTQKDQEVFTLTPPTDPMSSFSHLPPLSVQLYFPKLKTSPARHI